MCIRDRLGPAQGGPREADQPDRGHRLHPRSRAQPAGALDRCLLYTSDAADERSSVDLGGRRIIKKKNKKSTTTHAMESEHIETRHCDKIHNQT